MTRKFTKIILLFFTASFFAGCLEVNTTIHLNTDGSGKIEESVLMSSQVVQMLSAFAGSFDSTATDTNKFSLFKEDELIADTAKYGAGIKYISGKELKADGKEGYTALYSFTDINNLKINQNPNSKIDMEGIKFEEDSTNESLQFKFIKGEPSFLTIKTALNKNKKDSDQVEAVQDTLSSDFQGVDEFLKLMKDMHIALKLDISGNITETNASYVDGNEITLFDINFNDLFSDPEKLKIFKKQNPQNIEEIKELMKNIPGVKVELNNEVTVRFE